MKDNSLLLNIARDAEFLIEAFKFNQCFKPEGKKRIIETICSTVVFWYVVIPSCHGLLTLWNQIKYIIRGFVIHSLEHATETLITDTSPNS